ncbi:hypothetical protein Tco_0964252 [Tanacetum coccineum]
MENVNPPLTNNPPVLPTALREKVVQELNELQAISTYIDYRQENVDQFLNGFTQQPNEIDVDGFEPDNESIDTPLVSPFLDSVDDSDDGEVLNELEEYDNAGEIHLHHGFCGIRRHREFHLIMELLVKLSKRPAFWSLNEDILKITILKTNTPYPSRRYGVSVPALTKDHIRRKTNTPLIPFGIAIINEIQNGLIAEYCVSTSIEYGISSYLSNTAYSFQQINTAYPLPLDTVANTADIFTLLQLNQILMALKKELQRVFGGITKEDVVEHIAKVLKMVDLIYVPDVDSHQLRMKVFPLSLADDAKEWWISEGDGKITTWEELVEKFFCRFYPESYDGEDEMLDEGEN